MTLISETRRLVLRCFEPDDAEFVLRLVNDPAWLRYIGDRGVRTLEDAGQYIEETLMGLYRRLGFGLLCVELKDDGTPVGMCGLIKRDSLDDVDLGFAFLPEYGGRGYALESAAAVLAWGRETLGLSRFVAVTAQDNERAATLLGRLGFRFERNTRSVDDEELRLFGLDAWNAQQQDS